MWRGGFDGGKMLDIILRRWEGSFRRASEDYTQVFRSHSPSPRSLLASPITRVGLSSASGQLRSQPHFARASPAHCSGDAVAARGELAGPAPYNVFVILGDSDFDFIFEWQAVMAHFLR
jgi:hypothetical protein